MPRHLLQVSFLSLTGLVTQDLTLADFCRRLSDVSAIS